MSNVTVYKDKQRETWYVQYTVNKKRVRESLKTKSESVARRKAENIRKKLLLGEMPEPDKKKTLTEFWDEYLPKAMHAKRPKTIDNEKRIWRSFTDWLGRKNVFQLTQLNSDLIEQYRIHLIEKGMKKTSINLIHRHISTILTSAENAGYLVSNPAKKVKKFKVDAPKPKFLTKEEIDRLMAEAEISGVRSHIIFGLGIYAGFRKSEIVNARWEWFDFDSNVITIQANKDGFIPKSHRSRPIPLNLKLKEILLPYRRDEGYLIDERAPREHDEERIFYLRTDFRKGFESLVKRAGLDWVTPHILRHTFASQLAKAGVSLYKIQKWLGHSDPKTTMIYAHLQEHDDEINKI